MIFKLIVFSPKKPEGPSIITQEQRNGYNINYFIKLFSKELDSMQLFFINMLINLMLISFLGDIAKTAQTDARNLQEVNGWNNKYQMENTKRFKKYFIN